MSEKESWRVVVENDSLSGEEKSRQLTKLFMRDYEQKRKASLEAQRDKLSADQRVQSFHDVDGKVLGCRHYARKAKLYASCCGIYYPCRFCHDEVCEQKLDRFRVKKMMCSVCFKEQPVAESCTACGVRIARYFCDVCNFFDDAPDKDVYHCDKCGICRVGKGLGIDVFHCDTCEACVEKDTAQFHKCSSKCLKVDCPICGEYLFTSTEPGIFMKCGHTMHAHCYDKYTESHYRCPLCLKTILEMDYFIEEIERILENEQMPEEYAGVKARVLCSDCSARTETKFHFSYHKCGECGSYNTRLLQTFG